MTAPGRRTAICAQTVRALTGIDFVQVVDSAVQTVLRVFFIVDPEDTVPPIVAAGAVPPVPGGAAEGPAVAAGAPLTAVIATAAGGAPVTIVALRWRRVRAFDEDRVALEIEVAEPGGFEPYRLTLAHPQIDLLAGTILFDFKQACPTGFDCEADLDCPGDPLDDVPVDYLARDFHSIRAALLDFAAARYPDWKEPLEADTAVMLMEVMAALGDEFAYQQDRIAEETRFGSATQRASLAALARLVDYPIDPGTPASGELTIEAKGAGGTLPIGSVLWARPDAMSVLPFSTTEPIWVHPDWNVFDVHNPDPDQDCVGHGATRLMLVSTKAFAEATDGGASHEQFLVGRRAMILSDPGADRPKRAIPVTIVAIEEFDDPLVATPIGSALPTRVLQIEWDSSEATTVELPFAGLTVTMNVVAAAAGEPVVEHFRIGPVEAAEAEYSSASAELQARIAGLPEAVEREAPVDATAGERDVTYRYGLRATEGQSLRHRGDGTPDIELLEVVPPGLTDPPLPIPLPPEDGVLFGKFVERQDDAVSWERLVDLLEADLDDTVFTLDPGMWRTVVAHQLPFGEFEFQDYAADSGWTIRFGGKPFSLPPTPGRIIRVSYRTDPGVVANVASGAISAVPPDGAVPSLPVASLVAAATNPLPFGNARAEEDSATVRLLAPEAWRAEPRRAVRPEDYSAIIERMDFVQRASSTTRWTGSWSTDFVAVDPLDSIDLGDSQEAEVEAEIDCIRLAARDARRVDADYIDIDIEIAICVAADAYAGDVIEAVRDAVAAPGFFDPDHFTFGTPLSRSALEAAVQAVPGVRFVDSIRVRVHGLGEWRDFAEPELAPEPGQIIRLQNDPDRAALGLLRIVTDGGR